MKNVNHFKYWPNRVAKSLTIPETTLFENLEISAKKYPEKIALHYYGGTYTYSEIIKEVEFLAGYLEKELHVQKEEKILLFMQNSPQYIITYLAILRVRAVVVPINPMSTTNDLELFVKDCDIKNVIIGQELFDKVYPLQVQKLIDNIIVATYSDYVHEEDALGELPSEVSNPVKELENTILWSEIINERYEASIYKGKIDDVAAIPYTSGTTGLSKGCVHTNKTILANVIGPYYWMDYSSDAVVLTTLPLFHVTGLVHSALTPLYAGSTMVILTRWDRDYAAKAIEKFECSHWINISTMLIDFLANPNLGNFDISSLEFIGGGGASLPEAVGNQLYRRTGLRYVEGYGLTETIAQTHFNPPDRPKMECLGVPVFDLDARIIDLSNGEELGPNEEGELIVHGPQLFKGYYNREEENRDSHIEIDGKLFFKTGDIVKMDEEGYFYIIDRLKRMINAAGYKVWPTEVESILYKHPAIQQACVVSAPDPKRGETVKAYVILEDNSKGKVSEEDIIEWSKDQMAAYKRPRIVQIRETFPTTASGKILWRQLQKETEENKTEIERMI
ncbi:long-chain-fatty-acid--CoA ligase [Oceanobacillus sp. CF4.6]|uniref:long-chain-fatty-acid--CoA ligase n=1 Tax=Oceanobacillus sp. CF4.6 TaxID=3373080 RepID=UPI003EE6AFF8